MGDFLADELYHHGILGQKWGERRYQNPDGSLTEEGRKRYGKQKLIDNYRENDDYYVLKNKRFETISTSPNKYKSGKVYVYDADDPHDPDVYGGAFAKYKIMQGANQLYKHQLQQMRDIYVAPVKTQKKEFLDLVKKDPDAKKQAEAMLTSAAMGGFLASDGFKVTSGIKDYERSSLNKNPRQTAEQLKKSLGKDMYEKALFESFNSYAKDYDNIAVCNKLLNRFKDMGFDAVEDAYNKTGYFGANNPLRILDAESTISDKKVSQLTIDEIVDHVGKCIEFQKNWGPNKELAEYYKRNPDAYQQRQM